MIIVAYLLLQMEKLTSNRLTYSLLNLAGASAITFSLCFDPNLPSIVIESFWILISLIGVVKCVSKSNSIGAKSTE